MTRWSKVLASHDDDARVDAGWDRVRARRARPSFVKRARIVAPVLVLAAVLLFVVRGWLAPSPSAPPQAARAPAAPPAQAVVAVTPAASAALAPIALATGDALPPAWSGPAAQTIPLDDGSHLELAPQTVVHRGEGAADRVALTVESGRATFDVKPNGPRVWLIDAGEVQVRVLGTRFTVSRTASAVEVAVERGKVQVTSPRGTTLLTAGQSFTTDPPSTPARPPTPPRTASASPSPSPSLSSPPPLSPSPDPLTTADSLRRAGSPRDAVATLRPVVAAHDGRSALAAFTIGKISAEDLQDPSSAARAFEQAIALGLPAGLDEEAQARAVASFGSAGQRAEATRAAKRYEARYPAGRHLAQVQEWSRE